ncbi:unnamed protein product [Ectocarpus fasciculatus]
MEQTQDFSGRNVGDSEDSVVVSRDSSAEEITAGAAQSISAAPAPSLPWGTVAPSPDSSQPLPGPWGRLQEVMDEIKVMSPASPTSRVPHPFLSGARPSSTPAAEERKGFARTSSPPSFSTGGHPAGSSSASASTSSRIADSGQQPRQQEEKQQQRPPPPPQQQQQQQQQQARRSLSPSSSPHQVTSPPTPAASAANTPREAPTPAVQQPVAPASSLPSSGHLAAVEEQSQQSASSPRASAAAADGNEPGVDTKQEREEETPPVPVPGWALGYSTSASFSSAATGTRGVGGEVAATAAPTATAAAGSDSGAAPIGTASHGCSDEAGEVLEGLRGDDAAEDLANVRAVLPVEDAAATSGPGYVGQRFIQAAEALSESPQLRRAAGAAATAVSAAAGTARVQFTYTSRTIGKILVASAKSFEEFVDEQLQEDGSGQVLRREGATGLLVPRGKQLSQAFIVAPGCCLCWEFRVKDHDLGFALRRRFQGMGGSTEEDIFELKRQACSLDTFQGRWTADSDRNAPAVVIMVWDNSYSCLRPKTLAYKAQVNRPGIDPAAPPPPPPTTPAAMSAAQPPVAFGGGVGSVGGGEDTEAFAIDESEGEETSAYSAGVSTDRARVAVSSGGGGGGGGEEAGVGVGDKGGYDASATATSRRQRSNPTKGEGEGEGGREREGEGVPKTINIEEFLAMPETGRGDEVGGDRDDGADDGASK